MCSIPHAALYARFPTTRIRRKYGLVLECGEEIVWDSRALNEPPDCVCNSRCEAAIGNKLLADIRPRVLVEFINGGAH